MKYKVCVAIRKFSRYIWNNYQTQEINWKPEFYLINCNLLLCGTYSLYLLCGISSLKRMPVICGDYTKFILENFISLCIFCNNYLLMDNDLIFINKNYNIFSNKLP